MAFIIGLLTFFLLLDCLILILLVLIQLPKKEAGIGVAFGGAATDALFGAGSGNVLTKTTKYAAAAFFVLSLILGIMRTNLYYQSGDEFRRELEQQSQQAPPAAAGATRPVTPAPAPAQAPASTPATAPAPSTAAGTDFMLTVPPPATNTP